MEMELNGGNGDGEERKSKSVRLRKVDKGNERDSFIAVIFILVHPNQGVSELVIDLRYYVEHFI
jgi:hypothetical protein